MEQILDRQADGDKITARFGGGGEHTSRGKEFGLIEDMKPMIHVVALITAKSGKRDSLLEIFKANVPAVRAESGCIEYGATVDVAGAEFPLGPDTFAVIEKWESLAALKAHYSAPHMLAYGARTKELVAKRAVHVLTSA